MGFEDWSWFARPGIVVTYCFKRCYICSTASPLGLGLVGEGLLAGLRWGRRVARSPSAVGLPRGNAPQPGAAGLRGRNRRVW